MNCSGLHIAQDHVHDALQQGLQTAGATPRARDGLDSAPEVLQLLLRRVVVRGSFRDLEKLWVTMTILRGLSISIKLMETDLNRHN